MPAEVSDVYSQTRYDTFLTYASYKRRLERVHGLVSFGITIVVICFIPFNALERALGNNPYLIAIATSALFWIFNDIERFRYGHALTFSLDERFGMNRRSQHDFVLNFIRESVFSLALNLGFIALITFVAEHMQVWTGGFTLPTEESFLLCLGIVGLVVAVMMLWQFITYTQFRQQYLFTPLPDGALKDKIDTLLQGARHKVQRVYVYNQSASSPAKNALVFRLFWHREIAIADNFVNENSERELLAVLSHELGHLKHKKSLLDFCVFILGLAMFGVIVWVVAHPWPALAVCAWIRNSFGLSTDNYFLVFEVLSVVAEPLSMVVGAIMNTVSRSEEYEADREAVRNGYGEDLIATFKRLSSDELIDVNPQPLVEAVEYDHPSMYHRIKAIRAAESSASV